MNNNIDKYYELDLTEINPDNLFFSVVGKCKEKEILGKDELLYVDSQLNLMIEETARLCGKGYIREESARTMLKNIFMILDSAYTPSDFRRIISDIKEQRLPEIRQKGVSESLSAFDRTKKNFFHLEHFYYKYPELRADFAISLKNDYAFSNIYTHSFDNAKYTKAFFSFSENESFRSVCDRSEILCAQCALLSKMKYAELLPILEHRGYFRPDGGVKYTALLIDAVLISAIFSAFYRCEGFYPTKNLAKDILSELVEDSHAELCEGFESYIRTFIARNGIEVVQKCDSYGENILNVYASRLCEENIVSLAKHLADVTVQKRGTEKGLMNLIHFV